MDKVKIQNKNQKYDQIIQYSAILLLFVTLSAALLLLSYKPTSYTRMPTGFSPATPSSEESSPQGEVYSLYTNSKEPKISEEFTINIGVRNNADKLEEYLLEALVSKDGQIEDKMTFSFNLNPLKTVAFSPTSTLASAGKHEILVKLYDKYRSVLYDTTVLEINVISDIGPFDLALDVLSRTVRPSHELPLILRMKNTGVKGTDVKISLSMVCLEQENTYKDFSVFLKGGEELYKSSSITTCNEEGIRRITAELILFNHTFAESRNQVIINRTYYDFEIEIPRLVEIKQGESKIFDAYVKNTAGITVNNLKLIVKDIPFEWVSVNPSTIVSLEPNEAAMFLVNVSAPKDAAAIEYPITIAVGSDEALVQKDSILEISGSFAASEAKMEQTIDAFQYQLIVIFIAGVVALLLIGILRRYIAKPKGYSKAALVKLKDIVR